MNASDDFDIDLGESGLIPGVSGRKVEIASDGIEEVSLSHIVRDWSSKELGRAMTMEEWRGLDKARAEENRRRKELLNALISCKHCGERISRNGPETWHTESTMIMCADGENKAEL